MLSGRDLLVWAGNGANTPEDVAAMAQSLQPLLDSMFYVSNSADAEGRYISPGTAVDSPTVTYDPAAPVGTSLYVYGQHRITAGGCRSRCDAAFEQSRCRKWPAC